MTDDPVDLDRRRSAAGKIAADIRSTDFARKVIKSGESVESRPGSRGSHDHSTPGHEHPAASGVARKGPP